MPTQENDLIDVVIGGHRAVESVFVQLEDRTGDPEHRRRSPIT